MAETDVYNGGMASLPFFSFSIPHGGVGFLHYDTNDWLLASWSLFLI